MDQQKTNAPSELRRFQCTNKNLVSFKFGKIYDEVIEPGRYIYIEDYLGTTHSLTPVWVENNFNELPQPDMPDDPYGGEDQGYTFIQKPKSMQTAVALAVLLGIVGLMYLIKNWNS